MQSRAKGGQPDLGLESQSKNRAAKMNVPGKSAEMRSDEKIRIRTCVSRAEKRAGACGTVANPIRKRATEQDG